MKVTIPATIAEAQNGLNALGRIITARQWERAAIVAAYVQPDYGHGGRSETRTSASLESAVAFAARGIVGLRSDHTVARYVNAWLAERPRPQPGDVVNLDGLDEWPPESSTEDAVKRNSKATGKALADPDFARKVIETMGDDGRSTVVDAAAAYDPKLIAAAIEGSEDVADAVVADPNAHLEVIKASSRRHADGSSLPEPSVPEPFARLLTYLHVHALVADADAMRQLVVKEFGSAYVWRPGEREAVIERLDHVTAAVSDVLAVLTADVSDESLARLIEGGNE